MNEPTRKLTRAALSAAISVVLLLLAAVIPSGRLAMICLASLSVIFIYMSASWKWALATYGAAALLALLLLPRKLPAVLYAVFFGYYPILKFMAERLGNQALRWGVKFGSFNIAFLLCRFLLLPLTETSAEIAIPFVFILLGANLVFLIYDFALKQLILFYIRKIAGRVK